MLTAVIDYVTLISVKVHQLRSVHSSDSLTNKSQGICPVKLIARWLKRSSSSLLALSLFKMCPTRRKCR